MDNEKIKLRTDLSALTIMTAALSARVETLERQAAEAKAAEAKAAKPSLFAKKEKK